jgi:hypothetical protein
VAHRQVRNTLERSIMKNSKKCPKCQSTDIVRIPGSVGPYGIGNNIRLGMWTWTWPVKVTRYLYGSCGFSEEWIDSAAKLKKKFATLRG